MFWPVFRCRLPIARRVAADNASLKGRQLSIRQWALPVRNYVQHPPLGWQNCTGAAAPKPPRYATARQRPWLPRFVTAFVNHRRGGVSPPENAAMTGLSHRDGKPVPYSENRHFSTSNAGAAGLHRRKGLYAVRGRGLQGSYLSDAVRNALPAGAPRQLSQRESQGTVQNPAFACDIETRRILFGKTRACRAARP